MGHVWLLTHLFGQMPAAVKGGHSLIKSSDVQCAAGVYHLAPGAANARDRWLRAAASMPTDPRSRSEAMEWLFATLNSVEMASLHWSLCAFAGDTEVTPARKRFDEFLKARLQHVEAVVAGCEWLAGTFSVADIAMADVLRLVDRLDGLATCFARATGRPSFVKTHANKMAHVASAD